MAAGTETGRSIVGVIIGRAFQGAVTGVVPLGIAILRDVLRHGQMTRAQIQRLHFRREDGALASFQAACRRLRRRMCRCGNHNAADTRVV